MCCHIEETIMYKMYEWCAFFLSYIHILKIYLINKINKWTRLIITLTCPVRWNQKKNSYQRKINKQKMLLAFLCSLVCLERYLTCLHNSDISISISFYLPQSGDSLFQKCKRMYFIILSTSTSLNSKFMGNNLIRSDRDLKSDFYRLYWKEQS